MFFVDNPQQPLKMGSEESPELKISVFFVFQLAHRANRGLVDKAFFAAQRLVYSCRRENVKESEI